MKNDVRLHKYYATALHLNNKIRRQKGEGLLYIKMSCTSKIEVQRSNLKQTDLKRTWH